MGLFDRFKNQEARGQEFYCIVGLGNPGREYAETKHNVGFCVIDKLAEKYEIKVEKYKSKALIGDGMIRDKRVLLVKPQTFMNLSGEAVGEAARFYKVPPEKVIVLFDDISLPPGKLRIRRKGSAGGHNGIKSIIEHLNSEEFPRVKLGVGAKPRPDYNLADWVLSAFTPQDQQNMDKAYALCPEIVSYLVEGKIDEAMSRFSH